MVYKQETMVFFTSVGSHGYGPPVIPQEPSNRNQKLLNAVHLFITDKQEIMVFYPIFRFQQVRAFKGFPRKL